MCDEVLVNQQIIKYFLAVAVVVADVQVWHLILFYLALNIVYIVTVVVVVVAIDVLVVYQQPPVYLNMMWPKQCQLYHPNHLVQPPHVLSPIQSVPTTLDMSM